MGATVRGVEVVPVRVEVVVSGGLPGMAIVGMPDAAIQEARERVRAALRAAGFSMPGEKIVVNLAPSHLRKTGSGFDLPIALGILAATGQIDPAWARDALYVGELSLDGRVRPVAGTLACAICARRLGLDFVCAADSDPVPLDDVRLLAMTSLAQAAREGGAAAVLPAHGGRAVPVGRRGARLRGGRGSRDGQAGLPDRRGRRSRAAHDGTARVGQDHARLPHALHHAAALSRRDAGGGRGSFRGRRAHRCHHRGPAPLPPSASQRHVGRARRRWQPPAAGRGVPGPPRSALLGRAGGVQKLGFAGHTPAHGERIGDAHPGRRQRDLPGAVHARGGQQPVSLRVFRRRGAGVHLHGAPESGATRTASAVPSSTASTCIWTSAASVRRRFWSGGGGRAPRSCGRG